MSEGRAADERLSRCGKEHQPTVDEKPHLHLLPYGTAAQQATQDYALEASFLRIITIPAMPRLSNNQVDDSGISDAVTLVNL